MRTVRVRYFTASYTYGITDTSDPRYFGHWTLRHYSGGSELSGQIGTGAEVS